MNISKFKALLTAVDTGSFSAAAQKLGYTQSGMTHMMNSLENEIGFPLLQRGFYGVKLTANGERIIQKIRDLVACEDSLANEIDLVRNYGGNVIRVGAYSSMAARWLPTIVELFNREYPSVNVNIQTGTVGELFDGLANGRFDFVFGSKNPKYAFRSIPLMNDRFYAILPSGYPLEEEAFPISGFNGSKFLMPGLGFDDDISAVFAEHNVKPFVTPTYVDDPAILSMVEHSLGVSMLSELILDGIHPNVRLAPITPEVFRELCLVCPEDAVFSPAVKRFVAITKEFVKNYRRPDLVNMNKNR